MESAFLAPTAVKSCNWKSCDKKDWWGDLIARMNAQFSLSNYKAKTFRSANESLSWLWKWAAVWDSNNSFPLPNGNRKEQRVPNWILHIRNESFHSFSLNRNGHVLPKDTHQKRQGQRSSKDFTWEFFWKHCAGPKAPVGSYCFLEVTVYFLPVWSASGAAWCCMTTFSPDHFPKVS